jgi:hypothetical protein
MLSSNEAKIKWLQKEIDAGRYHVEASDIAEAIVHSLSDIIGDEEYSFSDLSVEDDDIVDAEKYRGVHATYTGSSTTYRAQIYANGVHRSLGTFQTALEAARAYDGAVMTMTGNRTRLNFPDDFPQE